MRIVNNYLNMCLQICVFCELGKELGAKIKIPDSMIAAQDGSEV